MLSGGASVVTATFDTAAWSLFEASLATKYILYAVEAESHHIATLAATLAVIANEVQAFTAATLGAGSANGRTK